MHDFSLDYGPYRGGKKRENHHLSLPSRLVSLLLAWHAFSPLIAQQWYFHLSPPPLPPFLSHLHILREKGVLRNAVSTEEEFDNFSDENNVEDGGNYTGIIGFLVIS